MSTTVIIIAEAEEQVRAIHRWWHENHGMEPRAFLDEFARATELLSAAPDIGQPFRRATRPGVRRLYLRRSQHWIYYVHVRTHALVSILAVWSTKRGAAPPL
jgi:plasmid stabilization system protein ParE